MTVLPSVRGFPDYMYPNGAAPAVLATQSFVASPDVTLGPFDVSSWPITELWFTLSAVAGIVTHVLVNQIWSADGLTVGTLPQKRCFMQAGSSLYDCTPNFGSILTVEISGLPNPGGSFSGVLNIVERGGVPAPHPFDHLVLNMPVQNVGAGAIITTTASLITPGPAHFYCAAAAVGFEAILEMLTNGNVWTQIASRQSIAGQYNSINIPIRLPASQLRMRIQNTTAAPMAMIANLTLGGY